MDRVTIESENEEMSIGGKRMQIPDDPRQCEISKHPHKDAQMKRIIQISATKVVTQRWHRTMLPIMKRNEG
jgi:hypothetical protein